LVQPFAQYINIGLSFSFASFFLFIAILPLVFASETLSDKIIKERELNGYIQKALSTVNQRKPDEKKGTEKEKKNSGQSNREEDENSQGTEKDKKACELTEKYY
jgi:hypothetical protein